MIRVVGVKEFFWLRGLGGRIGGGVDELVVVL